MYIYPQSTFDLPFSGSFLDFVLDWEDELPEDDLTLSHSHSMLSELSIVIGSTLQIIPAGNMPTYTKKRPQGKLVIINLQPTKHDKKADMVIRCYADKVFEMLFEKLNQGCTFLSIRIIALEIIQYCPFRNT